MPPPHLDQISELTRGIELPLAPLHPEHLRVIIDVLLEAWQDLLERHPKTLFEEDEAPINALMETRLLALLDEKPLWAQMVRAVARGRETMSFDGTHLEKRPDLSLYLTRRASFPLAIECKIIDTVKDKNGKLYCDKGICRFLQGEYAWAAREALMIAYVRDHSTIASVLASFLAEPAYATEIHCGSRRETGQGRSRCGIYGYLQCNRAANRTEIFPRERPPSAVHVSAQSRLRTTPPCTRTPARCPSRRST
jgi:hypothetical protein